MARPPESHARVLDAIFGPLETRVLETLWALGGPATVREVHQRFKGIAYTTLMTTLDRLHRKGVLEREKSGRAFAYTHRWSREDFVAAVAGQTIGALLAPDGHLQPLVSFFVDAVTRRDVEALEELERLVARRREESRS